MNAISVLPVFIVQHEAPSGSKRILTGNGGVANANIDRNEARLVPFASTRAERDTFEFGVSIPPKG